jgi:hypothetical protein
MSKVQPGSNRVDVFLREFKKPTGQFSLEKRAEELDSRIREAGLTSTEKVAIFRKLSPSADPTFARDELRMERLLLSVPPQELPQFKFSLEYDRDYKDIAEYVFHDIETKEHQDRIIEHFSKSRHSGIKVLTDVDDTMYANLIDERYPKKNLYPGVVEFYGSLKREPFDLKEVPVTTLTARPTPVAGAFEECSIESLVKLTNGRLSPSSLSGELISGVAGTLQTFARANLRLLAGKVPHDQEDKIATVKFENFLLFSRVYPEYRYVFIGDSGQADALTAQLMITGQSSGAGRVITTFIHDLRESGQDERAISQTFRNLRNDILITKSSASGRGVIVFRNYIAAAVVAHTHSRTLEKLISAEDLAQITLSALEQFGRIEFVSAASRARLREQYRQDAEDACNVLTAHFPSPVLEPQVTGIRQTLKDRL